MQAQLPTPGAYELRPWGWPTSIAVSPSGKLWLSTDAGKLYQANSMSEVWNSNESLDELAKIGAEFKDITCFSETTLMLSGSILKGFDSANFIYHSTNGGDTWQAIAFDTQNSTIETIHSTKDGQAWMAGSASKVYYTANSGQTWQNLGQVDTAIDQTITALHFNANETLGILGMKDGYLYHKKAKDAWTGIPSPANQGAYAIKLYLHKKYISKARTTGNYHLVQQDGQVFYTQTDQINWKRLADVAGFEVNDQNEITLIYKNKTVEQKDSNWKTLWKRTQAFKYPLKHLVYDNNNLIGLSEYEIYQIGEQVTNSARLLTNKKPLDFHRNPIQVGEEQFSFDGNAILKFDTMTQDWARFQILPIEIEQLVLWGNQLIAVDADLNEYYQLGVPRGICSPYKIPRPLFNPTSNKVVEFELESGVAGCFSHNKEVRTYQLQGENFVLKEPTTYLKAMPAIVAPASIHQLVKTIDQALDVSLTKQDLKITAEDLAAFDSLTQAKEQEVASILSITLDDWEYLLNPIDFEFHRTVSQNWEQISDENIQQAFYQVPPNYTTLNVWRTICFTFEDGSILRIENADDTPNHWCVPWTITYKGLPLKSNSMEIGRKIDDLTQGAFFQARIKDKKYAIFQVANYLYQNQPLQKE